MKGIARSPRRLIAGVGLLAALVPVAVGSAAQPQGWNAASAPAAATTTTVAANVAPLLPPGVKSMPLAGDFDVARFEAMAQAIVANQRVPGLAMAIVHDGKVLSARGYGITDVRAAEPVDAHTVFRLASLSKAFAGTVTGLLVAEGALRWDSHVADYMPSLRFSDPQAASRLTVADVLSHRVGLGRNTFDRDLERNADYRTLVQQLASAPMTCGVGDCYSYQNIAFSLVGDVVFGATGQFFSEAVTGRIFKPLGMNDASYGLEGIQASPRWARPHVRAGGGWTSLTPKPTYYRVAPAAGVNASISDMAQWLLAQSGRRPDVLPAPLLATLQQSLVSTPGELRSSSWRRQRLNEAGYALGWRVYDYSGHRVVFHGGAVQGYRGLMAMIPERDLGVVLLWNSDSSVPSGLLPTILDSAIGLAPQRWLDVDFDAVDDMLQAGTESGGRPQAGAATITAAQAGAGGAAASVARPD
ncbi:MULTISPECIES: serine hydrolase domain-containing protein [unclassified Luteimonas]|uniref:serine hydrolase domain-containing protein n=1 Tax=unclassified Luteimonas TaxID=2629088 RepID=UPI0015FEF10E|nr:MULTISPECIES: serine hydrolase domain-containing protein [unclassified Luteimonas]MBB1472791.1 beta-lactamase family protein [Luteimonas sp. MC1782]MBB6598505.1 beta-lactamase family protein [Luteimonas sp. MC1825]QOC88696.1 beta-lactamase family protein [Luteimonas sp. MC1825]